MENWQPVKGYSGLYEVSDIGRGKSLEYGKQKILKPVNVIYGYLKVNLHKYGNTKQLFLHRLVAEAFIPNPNNLETVNHKDEVKTNNAATNLEWMSRKDNCNYGTRNERVSEALSKQVQMFDKQTGELLATFPSTHEADRVTGIANNSISKCCRGKLKSAGGYVWCFTTLGH